MFPQSHPASHPAPALSLLLRSKFVPGFMMAFCVASLLNRAVVVGGNVADQEISAPVCTSDI